MMWVGAESWIKGKDDAWKARLTTWLINQREQGDKEPLITEEIVAYIDRQRPLPAHDRADRLLRFIAKQADTLEAVIEVPSDNYALDHQVHPRLAYACLAWSESIKWEEVIYLLRYLSGNGWIAVEIPADHISFRGQMTVAGHSRIEEQAINADSSQAFVAMWFNDSMDEAYEEGIAPAIREAGYKVLRIDQVEHAGRIDDRIIAEIRRSRFLVADFTHGKDGARGSVYYEAGFAHGLDIPVIFTCKEEEDEEKQSKLAFDTQQYNHIMWKTTDELHERLKDRIEAVIGEGPDKGRSKIGALTVNP
jgi:nucleoside 2-deoxyribosyltransferase